MGRLTTERLLAACAAAPGVALAGACAAWLVMAALGAYPFWHVERLTLSEAAALRDAGEVARLVEEGQDPNRVYRVRGGFLRTEAVELTPLEAARAADRPEIVALLRDLGARERP